MLPEVTISGLINIVNSVLRKEIDDKNNFPVGFTYYHVLERTEVSLKSIQLLIKSDIVEHDHAIGLISRNILTDFITTGYIIRLSMSIEEHYMNLYSLHYTDLKKVDALFKLYNDEGLVDEDKLKIYNEQYENETHIYKEIREYCETYNIKGFPAIAEIIKRFIKSEINDVWVDQIKSSYGTWSYLSKYEHVGWNSYKLTRNTDKDTLTIRLNEILLKTFILIGSCLEILKQEPEMKEILMLMKKFRSKI